MHRSGLASLFKSLLLIQVFVVVVLIGLSFNLTQTLFGFSSQPGFEDKLRLPSLFKVDQQTGFNLFSSCSMLLAGKHDTEWVANDFWDKKLPEALLVSNVQALAYSSSGMLPEKGKDQNGVEISLPAILKQEEDEDNPVNYAALFAGQKVVLYNTHNAETYVPDQGKARIDGKRGLVNQVGQELAAALNKRGLAAQHINTIHDWPEYSKSYTCSRETVKKVLAGNKNLRALFDIHRDSIPGMQTADSQVINGKPCARILIIVGTNERKDHPNWKKNLAFARALEAKAKKMYPGLIKGLRTKAGTYNQEFDDHALLLEFGNEYNSLAEAEYAADLFADVLVEVLKEEVQ